MNQKDLTYIYGLVDPRDNQIHYVGKSSSVERRLHEHLVDDSGSAKVSWLAELVGAGLEPRLEVLEEVDANGWRQREQDWIAKGIEKGWPLTNFQVMRRASKKTKYVNSFLSAELRVQFWELEENDQKAIADAIAFVGMFFSELEAIGYSFCKPLGLGFVMASYFAKDLINRKSEGREGDFQSCYSSLKGWRILWISFLPLWVSLVN